MRSGIEISSGLYKPDPSNREYYSTISIYRFRMVTNSIAEAAMEKMGRTAKALILDTVIPAFKRMI